ncbi:MAG: SLC13 family permease, partial [Ketobacter sp.]
MTWEAWFTLALLAAVLITLVVSEIAPYIIMMGALTLLSVTGVLTPQQALDGFSNPGLMTVAAMFIIAAGMQSSGALNGVVDKLFGHPKSARGALFRLCTPVLILSAFLNNTPVVATMIPAVRSWAEKIDIPASKLLLPLSYASILGGTITLIGTSTNLIVSSQFEELTGKPGFSLFSITALGLPVAVIGLLIMV